MINLNKFHNIHKGETCYIFGDGPSIKYFDLSIFDNHIGISCGNQIFHKDFNKLNVKYYTVPEPWLFCNKIFQRHKFLQDFKPLTNHLKSKIKKNKQVDFFINLSNFGSCHGTNIYFIHRYLTKFSFAFSKFKNIDPFQGSFYSALSLAYLMGFSKIYVIGHDAWTIRKISSQRWYEYGKGISSVLQNHKKDRYVEQLEKEIEINSIIMDDNSINLKSCTYEEFTGTKPKYQENNELTSMDNLKVFDTYPGYKIFK